MAHSNVQTDLWQMGGLLKKALHNVGIEVGTKPRPPSNAAAASLVLTLTGTNVALYSMGEHRHFPLRPQMEHAMKDLATLSCVA